MSWYDTNYTHRWPMLVDNLVASVAQIDVTMTIPEDLVGFWDSVQSDGDDIRITAADGVTELDFELRTWNYANKSAVVLLDNVTPPAQSCMFVVWVYWGYASAASASVPFVEASPRTGYGYSATTGPLLGPAVESPGATRPRSRLAKKAGETVQPWVDLTGLLQRRRVRYNGKPQQEEISYLIPSVYEDTTLKSAMFTASRLRMVSDGLVRMHATGGTTGTDYTLRLDVGTTEGRVIQPWWFLAVRDPTT